MDTAMGAALAVWVQQVVQRGILTEDVRVGLVVMAHHGPGWLVAWEIMSWFFQAVACPVHSFATLCMQEPCTSQGRLPPTAENRDGWLVARGLCGCMLIRFSAGWLLPFTLL